VSFQGVLFDLDGTLVDTAPDLVAVLNALLEEAGRPPMPYAIARNEVSNGAIGLLRLGFGLVHGADELDALRTRFLEIYLDRVCVNSRLFIKLNYFINLMDEMQSRWGIVTNKPHAFTEPLLERLGIANLPGCVVSGDRLRERKPHPAPLLLAARELGLDAKRCIYVGDASNDIKAGRAAGMRTVAAAYGYIRQHDDPNAWRADALVSHPAKLGVTLARLRTEMQCP
jgi:phosphoglycolate phosphatase